MTLWPGENFMLEFRSAHARCCARYEPSQVVEHACHVFSISWREARLKIRSCRSNAIASVPRICNLTTSCALHTSVNIVHPEPWGPGQPK